MGFRLPYLPKANNTAVIKIGAPWQCRRICRWMECRFEKDVRGFLQPRCVLPLKRIFTYLITHVCLKRTRWQIAVFQASGTGLNPGAYCFPLVFAL